MLCTFVQQLLTVICSPSETQKLCFLPSDRQIWGNIPWRCILRGFHTQKMDLGELRGQTFLRLSLFLFLTLQWHAAPQCTEMKVLWGCNGVIRAPVLTWQIFIFLTVPCTLFSLCAIIHFSFKSVAPFKSSVSFSWATLSRSQGFQWGMIDIRWPTKSSNFLFEKVWGLC